MTGSGRYDRRPRRQWEDEPARRSAQQQIGTFRLIGFFVLLVVVFAYTFQSFGKDDPPVPTGTSSATPVTGAPRIAAADALDGTIRRRLPKAKLRTGRSGALLAQLGIGSAPNADVAFLALADARALAAAGRCSSPQPIATRDGTSYAACALTTDGASRPLAAVAIDALTDIDGRDDLINAGFDVPEVRPSAVAP
ncbi:MAG: hypothetical protein PGN13_10880 [Patulibacter minatonensis]